MSILKRNSEGKENMYDYMVKVIIIGDSGVGKTNILTRFCEDIFKETHVATIGVDFNVRTIQVDDKKLRLQIWDTAGQERFKTITETYYKGAAGIILVYSVDNRESFNSIGTFLMSTEKWISQVNQRTPSSIKKILIANKSDITIENRQVSKEQGQQMAKNYNINYQQVSAKANVGIDDLFYTLSKDIKSKLDSEGNNNLEDLSRTITLNYSYQLKMLNKDQSKKQKPNSRCAC